MSADDVYACPSCGAEVHDVDVRCPACQEPLASTAALRMVGQLVMDQYEVLEVIGQGGMAVVYAARHRLTGQEVALKILPPELAAHRGLQSRFVEEARALARLDHANIVHLYNFGSDEGCFVLVMQLVRGKTWEKLIIDGDVDWRRSAAIAAQVCQALQYAHDREIIHRDMKPSNVLIRDEDERVMVMDFGIAKADKSSKLTDTGQTMGTVRYMSPEQVRGKPVDPRSDLYSLGVSLYEALSGVTPFGGDTHFDIMNAHLKVLPAPLSERAPEIPEALSSVVHWMLAKRRDQRPSSATEVSAALAAVLEGRDPEVPRASPAASVTAVNSALAEAAGSPPVPAADSVVAERRRGVPLAALAAVVALVAGGAIAFVALRDRGQKAATGPADARATGASPTAALPDAAQPMIPPGFEAAVELDYPSDGLRILAAPGASTEGIRATYRAGLARWRRYIKERGLDWPELERPVPAVTVLLGPGELVCDRAVLGTGEAHQECTRVGTYVPGDRTVRIPSGSRYTELALHSAIPIAHCASSGRCMDEARHYLLALFK